jgi:hypothetical protein
MKEVKNYLYQYFLQRGSMSEHDYVKQLLEIKELMIQDKIVGSEEFVGCTDDEVENIEKLVDYKLPLSFLAFLKVMGKSGGSYITEIPFVWEQLKIYRKSADEIIKENESDYQLPEDAFVFACLNGNFGFFRLNEGDDPPTYVFREGDYRPNLRSESLTAYLWMIARYKIESRDRRMKMDREGLASLK